MRNRKWSRRDVLKTSTAFAAGVLFAEPVRAAAPPPSSVTPELVEAARKEGKLSFYSALELSVAERVGKAFEAKYPGIAVRVERSGAERIFQRIAQEQANGINAVDVANDQGKARSPTAVGAEIAQIQSRRGAGAERGNQGALRQNVLGVIDSEGGALRSVCPEYFP
jgi:hypothetical protein